MLVTPYAGATSAVTHSQRWRRGIVVALDPTGISVGVRMPMNFIGRTSPVDQLKASMDVSSQRVRAIADRVARASTGEPVFSLSLTAGAVANPTLGPVDVESEMVNLADEQLRYEAAAKLLEKTYAGLRASLQER